MAYVVTLQFKVDTDADAATVKAKMKQIFSSQIDHAKITDASIYVQNIDPSQEVLKATVK
jgi:hypothetical protein